VASGGGHTEVDEICAGGRARSLSAFWQETRWRGSHSPRPPRRVSAGWPDGSGGDRRLSFGLGHGGGSPKENQVTGHRQPAMTAFSPLSDLQNLQHTTQSMRRCFSLVSASGGPGTREAPGHSRCGWSAGPARASAPASPKPGHRHGAGTDKGTSNDWPETRRKSSVVADIYAAAHAYMAWALDRARCRLEIVTKVQRCAPPNRTGRTSPGGASNGERVRRRSIRGGSSSSTRPGPRPT
jgi:hypothetical protein